MKPRLTFIYLSVFYFCGLLFTGLQYSYGQTPGFVVDHYTSENGLPQNSIMQLLFDKNGFLWMASESGLIRFDNREMRVFGLDNIAGLKDERIHELKLDIFGNVVAKNLNHQVILTAPVDSFSSPEARLMDKPDDGYYYPTWGYLNRNPLIGYLWDSLKHTSNLPSIRTHASLANGEIYLLYQGSIYFIGQQYKLLKSWMSSPVADIPVGGRYMVQFWKAGKVAIWSNGNLLNQTRISGDALGSQSYLQGEFKVFWCPNGSFIYAGKDLFRLDYDQGQLRTKLVLQDIDIESPACLYFQPGNNTYYFGSNTSGLYVVKVSDFSVPRIPEVTGSDAFYAVTRLPGDTLVVRNTVIPPSGAAYFHNLNADYLIATFVDTAGIMYYGSNYSLASYNAKRGSAKKLVSLDEQLVSILPYKGDRLLLCTHASYWIVSKEGKVYARKRLPIDYDRVKAKGLYPLGKDRYILLTTGGVKWYNLPANRVEQSMLDSINFRSFYRDKKGRFWFGSDGSGGYMYAQGKMYSLPLGPLNAFKSIHAFIDDHKGFFWLTTNNGLYRVQIQQLADYLTGKKPDWQFYALNNKDGLLTNEFNGGANPAYQWLSNGTLVLPSMHGLVEFNPDSLRYYGPENKIFVDWIRVDSTNIHLSTLHENTQLSPRFNRMEVKVSCPYFGNTKNLELNYKIVEGDQKSDWIRLPQSGVINVNRLPAGDYKIMIKKVGYFPADKAYPLELHFTVLPYFYNTWWFYLLMLLLFAAAGYVISRRRINHLKRQNLEIDRLVTARTAELQFTTAQLEVSEAALKQSNRVKEQIIAMVLHDLRSPVRFLGTISQHMIQRFMDRPREENLESLKKLHKSVGLLWSFIEQFFAWAVSQQNAFQLRISAVAIQDVFDNVERFYAEILAYNGNDLEIRPTKVNWDTDRDILTLIVRNLLDNSNKYTESGKILVEAAIEGGKLKISVKDTGRGLSEQQVQQFMDAVNVADREGNGSLVILQMLKKIGGNLHIETKIGAGSEFTIELDKLPLPDNDPLADVDE